MQGIGETSDGIPKELVLVRREVESVLGMKWLPKEDMFTYTFTMREDLQPVLADGHIPTKREVLKVVMSLFDPLGLIAFYIVHGKVLIQDIWASGCSWDEAIGNDLYVRWRQWTNLFPELPSLKIPRCYFHKPLPENLDELELHVFVELFGVLVLCILQTACRELIPNCSG